MLLALAGSREPEIRETEPVKPPSCLARAERGGNWTELLNCESANCRQATMLRTREIDASTPLSDSSCVSVCLYVDAASALDVNYRIVYLIYDRIKDELRNLPTSIKRISKSN